MAKKVVQQYDWEFIDPPSSDYYCPLCKKILIEPMLTNCCGSHFCKTCIDPVIQAKQPCPNPECNETEYLSIVDKPKWRKILELDVICPLKGRGCNWMGEIGTRSKHLDPKEGDCQYIDVDCTYGCGEDMERYELAEHLKKFCPKRPYTCEYCGIENLFEIITNEHMPDCPAFPVSCPNNCGCDNITRSSCSQHLLKCPEQVVECDFTYAGCEKRVVRKNMAQHQQEDVYTHLSLQTAFASKQLAERDQQIKELSSSWEERFQELTEELRKLSQECARMKLELKRKEMKISELRAIHKLDMCLSISDDQKLTLKQGNIVDEDVDIIVNTAGHLDHRMGVSKALNEAADGLLQKYTNQYIRTHLSENVGSSPFLVSSGGALRCKHVMYAFGPSWDPVDLTSAQDGLNKCIQGVLELAESENVSSIALPAISAGRKKVNKELVAKCIINTIMKHRYVKPYPVLSDIRIVIIDDSTYEPFVCYFKQFMYM